jgi:nucleoid-associated protein YgaU
MDNRRHIVSAFVFLVVLWIAVYWWWEPGGERDEPAITFDEIVDVDPAAGTVDAPDGTLQADGSGQAGGDDLAETGGDPEPVDPTPKFRSYTVKRGDTFETIAIRELGSASLQVAIAKSNPFKDPMRIKPGDVIRIPLDPGNIQGDGAGVAVAPPLPPPAVEYVVRRGDTLGDIALAFYGSARPKYLDLIYSANRGTMRDRDTIAVGQKLMIPPAPPSSSGSD